MSERRRTHHASGRGAFGLLVFWLVTRGVTPDAAAAEGSPAPVPAGAGAGTGTESALSRYAGAGPFTVGVRTLFLEDPARREDTASGGPRRLVVEVWYPASGTGDAARKTTFADFFGPYHSEAERVLRQRLAEIEPRFHTLAYRGAPLAAGARCPLLVFSHGNGGFRHQNVFQADHLASHGYIVASPDHTGNSRLSPLAHAPVPYDRRGRSRSAEARPADVRFMIDWFLRENREPESWLAGALEPEAIGVLGHSFGGYAACRAATEDPRIRAILPMTVAAAGLGTAPAAVPTMVLLGNHDRTMGAAGNFVARAYYNGVPAPRYLLSFQRGGHFTFCDMAVLDPDFGDGIGRGNGADGEPLEFIPTALAKRIINAYSVAFFDRHVKYAGAADGGEGRAALEAARRFLERNHFPEEIEYLHEGS